MKKANDYLRDLRHELNYTQETMADLMGIRQPSYYRLESGKKKINLDDIEKISKATNKTKEDIILRLNGIVAQFAIYKTLDIQNMLNINECVNVLLKEKDKNIMDIDMIILHKDIYINFLEDILKNLRTL